MNTKSDHYEKGNRLSKTQRETIGILSIGNFLEHFDMLLYVHMAMILGDLFFPTTDPFLRSLTHSLTIVSMYVFTPFGALFFGSIGDILGRKAAIVLTTLMMSLCCICTAILPTYAQIGVAAPILLVTVRALQSMFATTEFNGVRIYLTESFKPPLQYPIVASATITSSIAAITAMLIGFVCTSPVVFSSEVLQYSWRFPFIFGALVGLAGAVARSTIKEASDFADRKKALHKSHDSSKPSKKVSWATILAYFTMLCGDPACMYFAYFYCGNLLRNNFGLSPNQVLLNNCVVGFSDLLSLIFITYLSYRVFPLKIIKAKCVALCAISFAFPVLLELWPNRFTVLTIQCLIAILNFAPTPAWPILYKHFPVLQRFRYTGFIIALARLAIYGISPFAMGSAIKNFGYKGIPLFFMLFGVCVYLAITFFERKEKTIVNAV